MKKRFFIVSVISIIMLAVLSTNEMCLAKSTNEGFGKNKVIVTQMKNYSSSKKENTKKSKIKCGDINLDGKIDGKDLMKLTQYLEKKTKLNKNQLKNADVTGDGKVDEDDKNTLTKYLANFDDETGKSVFTLPFKIICGDVNLDGQVTSKDAVLCLQYINFFSIRPEKYDIGTIGKENADVNEDGIIDVNDVAIINYYANGSISSLPFKMICGDVNLDEKVNAKDRLILARYLDNKEKESKGEEINWNGKEYELNELQLKNADVNEDKIVDSIDGSILGYYAANWSGYTLPFKMVCGDIKVDGTVDGKDLMKLTQYLNNQVELNEVELKNADLNADGNVDENDKEALRNYLANLDE